MKKSKILFHFRSVLAILMCAITFTGYAQTKTVTGTVLDKQNEPLIGVTVKVQGTTNGTVTNFDGVYSLSNVSADANLEFSYVGMKLQVQKVSGQSVVNVTTVS